MMNDMSGQISGQLPNQATPQVSGLSHYNRNFPPSQTHNLGSLTMDRELMEAREDVKKKIAHYLQRRNLSSSEWQLRLPELANRLEECVFKNAASKEVYMNMAMEPIGHHLQAVIKNLYNHNQSLPHHITSSSTISTMIPTPCIPQNSSTNSIVSCSVDSSMITTSVTDMVDKIRVNTRSLQSNTNGLASVGHNASFDAFDGSVPNRYQQSPANLALPSGGSSMMPTMGTIPCQLIQMIPTPGMNNLQPVSMNSGQSNGREFSSIGSTIPHQQQKQYPGSQNSHILHNRGGEIGARMRSNMQQRPSTYGFPNGVMNGGLGVVGSNMQLLNGPSETEGYLSTTLYGSSPKQPHQHFDQQHHQPIITTSSQQILPIVVDGYVKNVADHSGTGSLYGPVSSDMSAMDDQNMNTMSMPLKSKIKPGLLSHHASLQSMGQTLNMKPLVSDHSQKVNFQPPREHLLQSQEPMQQAQQKPNQPYVQFVQNQHQLQVHQQSQQHQKSMLKIDILRQSSITSSNDGQLIPNHGTESRDESLLQEAAERFHLPELHSQCQQNVPADVHANGAHLRGHLSSPQDFHASFSESSQQMLHSHQQAAESQTSSYISSGSQPEAQQKAHMPDKTSLKQHVQEEFHQKTTGQDEAKRPRFSLEGFIAGRASTTRSVVVPQISSVVVSGLGNSIHKRNYHNQFRWLLFLYHARGCSAPKGECQEPCCVKVQHLLMHMDRCNGNQCAYPRCASSRRLLEHFHNCRAADCPVCIRVRCFVASYCKARAHPPSENGLVSQKDASVKTVIVADAEMMELETGKLSIETFDDSQPFLKRMKVNHTSLVPKVETYPVSVPSMNQSHASQEAQSLRCSQADMTMSANSEVTEVKVDPSIDSGRENPPFFGNFVDGLGNVARSVIELVPHDASSHINQEILVEREIDRNKMEVKQEETDTPTDLVAGSKSTKLKIKGVSLTELFTPEQIRDHIVGLRQWIGQSKAKAEKNQAMGHSMSENSCQLCAMERTFEPPPIYCTRCNSRIKRNATYYTMGSGETRHYFCTLCYCEARGDSIEVDGSTFQKAKLEKKRNDELIEESWVQCDKCEAWQHQICALFNGRRNDGEQAEYTCPKCYIKEIERGERKPLPQSAFLGAKDLPRTILSDHIEQRLLRRLKQERQERARHLGKKIDEVPGAEALVIRVVSSVDKKVEVKQRFLEIFQEEDYPTEFPYKSKVILLFQKIEGVEVCIFGMYVQEFGSDCSCPNQRRVYLSYLDSVKYFRPEAKTVTGEALRTFVYHEILIGYLEYCKKRGFTSCYIWACPPLKGEDYILYCHPDIQKTPKSDKLREWYLAMLRKASKENIVVDLTNFYDHFFITIGECKAKVTAARLPYFDGDYWPGAVEDMINQLRQEEDGRKHQKKVKTKKSITKRSLIAAGQGDLAGNTSKDALLMQKLGKTIYPMKEDFIMVHLQHACTRCCLLMVSGTRWVCNQCKSFQLCEKCHDAEQILEERDRHPINSREKHVLRPVEINDVPTDTKDKDEILESEFFDTRQAFLGLCQGNHYRYDTLRRAKHSSMMVLYHLHNPTAPAFVTTCIICHHEIEAGQGWRCDICPDFDVCSACYQKEDGVDHPHKLTNYPSVVDRDAQNKEARQKRVSQLRKMLHLLVHASQCRIPHCQYSNCHKVKGLFGHGIQCKIRASRGCRLCKRMWYLLQLHAQACKESECHVPRCKDLKEHLKRLQQQSDSRRRAAVMEMMRQRAAEFAGNNG